MKSLNIGLTKKLSLPEFFPVLLQLYIDIQNGNFQLPTLEQQRINQIAELLEVLSKNVASLEDTAISGFDSLLGLTRGDNYLLEQDEDGEL